MKLFEILVALIYGVLVLWWAISSKKQAEKGGKEFFASYKTFGALLAGIAAATSGMSGFGLVGVPGLVYKLGGAVWYITIFFALSFGLMMWLNGKPMRMMGEIITTETFADLGYHRFNSNTVRFLIALNLIICVWAYLGTQILAAGYILHYIFGISIKAGGVIVLLYTILYTVYGGMVGSIKVDFLQGLLKIGSALAVLLGFYYITGGMSNATLAISASKIFGTSYVDPIGHPSTVTLPLVFAWIFALGIGTIGQPHVNTKLYSLKDYKSLRFFGVTSGIAYSIMSLFTLFPAMAVFYLISTGKMAIFKNPDDTIFHFMSHLPPILAILLFAGLLAATMSTSSSFLVIGSAVFTLIYPRSFGKKLDQKQEVVWGRWALIILSIGAIFFGLFGGYLIALLGVLGLGTFIATSMPVIIGYQWQRASKEAAIVAELITLLMSIFVSVIYVQLLKGKMPGGIPDYAYMILLTTIVMIFVSLFTKGSARENLPPELKIFFKYME
ncbi:sodium:solute symporter family protein [Desulfurella sp.]|uniref:sodium:solute symporter family protein n=1 Tax=Desulfurella sp. TaxID=1962857 RepID=UPI00257E4909|nr:hypothetical protein [Desulfurella sp.]